MTMLFIALLGVPVLDGAVKHALRRRVSHGYVSMGTSGSIRVVRHRLWLSLYASPSPVTTSALLALAAVPLVMFGALVPSAALFVGLLIGGALSNWLEQTVRGSVTDYICVGFWPAFNLADAAITIGATGIALALWTLAS